MKKSKSNNDRHPILTSYTSPHGIPPLLLLLLLTPSLLYFATAQPLSNSNSSSDSDGYYTNNINPSTAIIVIVLVLVFFIVGITSLYIQCAGNSTAGGGGATIRSSRLLNNAPRGLDPSVIESFPTFIYSSVKSLKIGKGSLECAICLCEFDDSDSLRLLTKCDHVFHADCIDSWLAEHVTCPVCRANLIPDPTHPPPIHSTEVNIELQPQSSSSTEVKIAIPLKFPRSHSTGHSLTQPGDDVDRFTLRLPLDVRRQLLARAKLKRATSLVALPRATSSRRGYRSGGGGGGEGSGSSRYGRILGAFGLRIGSFRSVVSKVGGDRDGSTSSRRVLGTPVMPLETLREPTFAPV